MIHLSRNNKKYIRPLLLALFAMGYTVLLHGQQVPTVRIDPYSRVSQQAAPFDHHFYLLLPVDTTLQLDELKQVNLYKMTGKPKSSNQKRTKIKFYLPNDLQTARFVDTPKEAGFKYLRMFVDTQLLPNTRFSIVLVLKPSHAYLDQLNTINQELRDTDLLQAQKDYQDLTTNLTIKYSTSGGVWPPFDTYRQFFIDSLQSLYQTISTSDTTISNNMTKLRDTLKSSGFHISQLFECNCQKDFVATELFSDSTKFLIPIQNLLNVPDALLYFAAGRLNIQEFEPYQTVDVNDLQKRIDNYGRLKTSLLNISYFFHLSSFADGVNTSLKKGIYNSILVALKAIDKRVKTLKDVYTKIRIRTNNMESLFSAEMAYGGTSPYGEDLQTSSGHYIIADFGLANAGTFVNNKFGYLIRPYLGVNFSFIAIDKSQPLNTIENKRFLHHLSAVIGLTTSALSRQGTSDLINNFSVVGGLAYRISRGFRFTFGALVYKRDNPNPLLQKRVTVGPMIAGSLDLDIAKWFGDLKSKLY